MRTLIAPNSFKECADSVVIARLMEENLCTLAEEKYNTEIHPVLCPISDGGDGFLRVLEQILNLERKVFILSSPWHEGVIYCETGYHKFSKTLFIESANVLGLKLIPAEKRHPLDLSSKGLGELLIQLETEVRNSQLELNKVIIGIGGTGTCDFGLGMCSELGLSIFDENGKQLKPIPENFCRISEIIWDNVELPFSIDVILDVNSPLLGKDGASRAFAPQKGATEPEVEKLEEGIMNYLRILNNKYPEKKDCTLYGAGGGIAAALHYFLGANYKFSRDFVREYLIKNCSREQFDFVISGEGAFDDLTFLSKGAMIVIDEFKNQNIPVFVCAGMIQKSIDSEETRNLHFIDISSYFSSKEESIKNIKLGIKFAMQDVLKIYFSGKVSI